MKLFIFSYDMKISVVIGTRANEYSLPHIRRILQSLLNQTFKSFDINLICDRKFETEEEFELFQKGFLDLRDQFPNKFVFTNLNSDFIPQSTGKASSVRNFWMQHATGEFIQLLDDDNAFDENFFETELERYHTIKKEEKSECIFCPTLYYRDTGNIQNQGFSKFLYWQARPQIHLHQKEAIEEIQMFSWNGIFWKKEVLQSVQYDEEIARIAEDIDFTLSLHEQGVKIFCIKDLEVRHYEREKTILEQARIWSYEQARQKARNRFLFIKKHATFLGKLQFFCIGLPWCLTWLSLKILRYWANEKGKILKWLRKGCKEGLQCFFQKIFH